MDIITKFTQAYLKSSIPNFRSGDTVKVFQKIKEGDKERIQVFEGLVIARKHGKGSSATFTVRKIAAGVGVEKIYPLHSPLIEKIEVMKSTKVRRSKLYFVRQAKGKRSRLKSAKGKTRTSQENAAEASAEEATPAVSL